MAEQKSSERFRIEIAADQLTATLSGDNASEISEADVVARLKELKIQFIDMAAITEALVHAAAGGISLVVARGVPPVDERPGKATFKTSLADTKNGIVSRVNARQLIGTVPPPHAGSNGRDVFGKPIAPKSNLLPFQLGPGVKLEKGKIFSEVTGNVRLIDNRLSVVPLMEVDGSDDTAGPIVSNDGDVAVKGSLREGRAVHCKGSLVVGGTVKASMLKVGASVYTQGGIIGKNKGKCVIGDELRCAFITGTSIVAGGDVHMQSEVQDSRIFCSGQLHIARGPIVGGEISANGGIVCQTIGHLNGTATVVGAGTDRVTKSLVAAAHTECDANQKLIDAMRSKISPLMEKMKSLTPEQRERVTELLYEADELESKNKDMLTELDKRTLLMQQKASAEILVAEMIYPGVKIRLPGVEAVIPSVMQGPLKITLALTDDGQPQIAVTKPASGSIYMLPSSAVADPIAPQPQVERKAA